MTARDAIQYLEDEFEKFAKINDKRVGQLLELTVSQITFVQLVQIQMGDRLEVEDIQIIRSHLMKTLEAAAHMAGIGAEDIDRVIKKSMELVDCMKVMTDPTHTNLH